MKKTVLLFFLIFILFSNVFSQADCFMSTTKNVVMVGEPFEITVKIFLQNSFIAKSVDFSPIRHSLNTLFGKDSILFEPNIDIELLSSSRWKNFTLSEPYAFDSMPLLQNGNASTYENTLTFAIYNPGVFILNLPELDNGHWSDSTNISIEVTVPELDSLSAMSRDTLYPIKPIILEPTHWTDYLPILYILLGIILVYYLIKYVKKRKVTLVEVPVIETKKLPHEIALEKLEALENSKLAEQENAKEFQSQLTFIFREYIENQFNIKALEMSTTECILTLTHDVGLATDLINSAGDILNMADLVKFAKAQTLHETHAQYLDKVRLFIQATKITK